MGSAGQRRRRRQAPMWFAWIAAGSLPMTGRRCGLFLPVALQFLFTPTLRWKRRQAELGWNLWTFNIQTSGRLTQCQQRCVMFGITLLFISLLYAFSHSV